MSPNQRGPIVVTLVLWVCLNYYLNIFYLLAQSDTDTHTLTLTYIYICIYYIHTCFITKFAILGHPSTPYILLLHPHTLLPLPLPHSLKLTIFFLSLFISMFWIAPLILLTYHLSIFSFDLHPKFEYFFPPFAVTKITPDISKVSFFLCRPVIVIFMISILNYHAYKKTFWGGGGGQTLCNQMSKM